jgi:hypothetical protein
VVPAVRRQGSDDFVPLYQRDALQVRHANPHAFRCFAEFCALIIASLAAFSALSLTPRCSQVSRTAATFLRFTFS